MKGHFANPRVNYVRLGGPSGFFVGAGRFRPAEPLNLDRFNVNAVIIGFRAYLDSMDRSNWPELQVKFHASLPRLPLDAIMRSLKANLSRRRELRSCGGSKTETSPSRVGSVSAQAFEQRKEFFLAISGNA